MIFVYPAIVSGEVDDKIAVAASKMIEQFYLSNLLESFSSGNIRVKTIWNPSKKVYGELQLENKKVFGKTFLSEAKEIKSPNEVPDAYKFRQDMPTYKLPNTRNVDRSELTDIKNDVYSNINDLNSVQSEVSSAMDSLGDYQIKLGDPKQSAVRNSDEYKEVNGKFKDLEKLSKDIQSKIKIANIFSSTIQTKLKDSDNGSGSEKESREKEKHEEEKKRQKLAQLETHGSYKVTPVPGISLSPSVSNISVEIQYVGGDHDKVSGGAGREPDKEIAVGVKVLPMKVENFRTIETAILDDYFSTKFIGLFKQMYRGVARKLISFGEKAIKKIIGKNVDLAAALKLDEVQKNILLAPQGLVNASSFKRKSTSPGFYNYSSSVVIMNKDDVTELEGANFFKNRSQLQKMFKLGWNSFCILDDIRSEVMFISAIDGGALHVIPYAYMFNSLKMDQVYTNMADMSRRSPFMRIAPRGNFGTLVSKLTKESKMVTAARKAIQS